MTYIDFVMDQHKKTKRNYLERVTKHDKAKCAEIALQFGVDYWDGDRKHGYGGYYYDHRWIPVAARMAEHYNLTSQSKVLDVGSGKGFLLYEFTRVVPGITVAGIDISEYALSNTKEEVQPFVRLGNAADLPFEDNSFDLVVCLGVVQNLYIYELYLALKELERVGKNKYLSTEAYTNEREKVNLLYWQLTCRCFYSPEEWVWIFKQAGYTGDYSFIYFE